MLGILQIEVVLVFPDDHHVVASIVVVGIGSMDVGWLEVLQQNDDRLRIFNVWLQLLQSHVLFAYDLQLVLEPISEH